MLCNQILSLPEYQQTDALMAYYPLFGEPDLIPILEDALAAGKRLFLPQTDAQMQIHPRQVTHLSQLQSGAFSVMEPPESFPESMDFPLLLMPAVAYDRRGNRLGHGAGCYDRFLAHYTGRTIGVCFSIFLLDEVPCALHDRTADLICTEHGIVEPTDR